MSKVFDFENIGKLTQEEREQWFPLTQQQTQEPKKLIKQARTCNSKFLDMSKVTDMKEVWKYLQYSVDVPLLVNLSKCQFTLNSLHQLSTYFYMFTQKSEIAIHLGQIINGNATSTIILKPKAKSSMKMANRVLKALLLKNVTKKTITYNGTSKTMYDLSGVHKNGISKYLVFLANVMNATPTKHTKEIGVFGMDRRQLRDALGLYVTYKDVAYDKIRVLTNKYVGYSTVKNFMKNMTFFKLIGNKPVVIDLASCVRYYKDELCKYFQNTYTKEILYFANKDTHRMQCYAMIFGINEHAFTSTEEYLATLHAAACRYSQLIEDIDPTISVDTLLEIADTFKDNALAHQIYIELLMGKRTITSNSEPVMDYLSNYQIMQQFDLTLLDDQLPTVTSYGDENYLEAAIHGCSEDDEDSVESEMEVE